MTRKRQSTSPRPSPSEPDRPSSGEGAGLTLADLQVRGVVALTKTQMAAALQISVRSLNGMMARGEIAYFKIGSRLVRFHLDEALKQMNETVLVRES